MTRRGVADQGLRWLAGQLIRNFREGQSSQSRDFFTDMVTWKEEDKKEIQREIKAGFKNALFKDSDPVEVFNKTIREW